MVSQSGGEVRRRPQRFVTVYQTNKKDFLSQEAAIVISEIRLDLHLFDFLTPPGTRAEVSVKHHRLNKSVELFCGSLFVCLGYGCCVIFSSHHGSYVVSVSASYLPLREGPG